DRLGFSATPAGPVSVATKHKNPQVKPVVFESRSLVLRIVQVFWLIPQVRLGSREAQQSTGHKPLRAFGFAF
ncbi:MAG: hypothetical protein WCK15_17410, partial [Pirellula sp.]